MVRVASSLGSRAAETAKAEIRGCDRRAPDEVASEDVTQPVVPISQAFSIDDG
jgi:hypothetical protein